MTLYLDKRAFSWGHPLPLTDQTGRLRYTITSDAYAPRKHLLVLDLAHQPAVSILQSLPSLFPRYEIETYGKPVGTVQKDLRFSPPQYHIDPPAWVLEGSAAIHEYTLLQNQAPIAVCRPHSENPGHLVMEFQNSPDALTALGIMIVLNCALPFHTAVQ